MKIWKMVGCLGLLVVIICSCVMLANPTEVSAQVPEENKQDATQSTPVQKQEQTQPSNEQAITVEKTYSTGLAFRSNGDGTCAVSGLGTCKDSYLLIPPKSPAGDVVYEILPGALASDSISAVEIPVGMSVLSADSFAGCALLSHVRIATGNPSFLLEDGVLYTADGQTLLYCPVARGASELTLHASLQHIAAGAFAKCSALSTVYFSGSTADWRNIRIGDDNDALYEAAFKFNG